MTVKKVQLQNDLVLEV